MFNVRQKEILNLYDKINNHRDIEPFAIMVKGKWGSGKTSFINGFKDYYSSKFDFIDVNVGYACDTSTILNEIDRKLQGLFTEESFFYRDNNTLIRKYFKILKDISSDTNNRIIETVRELLSNNESFEETKESLNDLLDEYNRLTGKRIIIVIDDLERCPASNLNSIFSILIETFKLNNCITIMLCDYEQLEKRIDGGKEFLDKYISKSITLQIPDEDEQINMLLKSISEFDHSILTEELEALDEAIDKLFAQELFISGADVTDYKNFLRNEDYFQKYRLPRTKVRFANSILVNTILVLYDVLDGDDSYFDRDWIKGIIYVSFLENVIPEVYDEIVTSRTISDYKSKAKTEEEKKTDSFYRYTTYIELTNSIDDTILASIFYKRKDSFVSPEYKEKEFKLEWDANSLEIANIKAYTQFLYSNADMLKLLSFMQSNNYVNADELDISVFNIISDRFSNFFKIDDKSKALCEVIKDVYRAANKRWGNALINSIDVYDARHNSGDIRASFDKINQTIIFKCEEVMTEALQKIEQLKAASAEDFNEIGYIGSGYESFYKITKRLFPEIEAVSPYTDTEYIEKNINRITSYTSEINCYINGFEGDYPDISSREEYLYFRDNLKVCIEIMSFMKQEFIKSGIMSDPDEKAIVGLFDGEKVAQANKAALISKIAEIIDNVDEKTLMKKWRYILDIVEIGVSELRHAITTNPPLEDYHKTMLAGARKIYDIYKSKTSQKEFADYYWVGIELMKLEQYSEEADSTVEGSLDLNPMKD